MTTPSEREAALADEFRPVLARYGLEYEDQLLRDLAVALSGFLARQIEAACRPHPWPPRRNRTDAGQAAAREARKTA